MIEALQKAQEGRDDEKEVAEKAKENLEFLRKELDKLEQEYSQ